MSQPELERDRKRKILFWDCQKSKVEVRGDIPQVRADPDRIEQVLTNLLSNAGKYSYPVT